MSEPKAICDQCGQEFWKVKDWQRFCQSKCRDDWHNYQRKIALVEMSGFRPTKEQRQAAMEALPKMRRAEIPDAPHPWRNRFSRMGEAEERVATANGATGNHKPLAEIVKSLKRAEPQVQQQLLRRSW